MPFEYHYCAPLRANFLEFRTPDRNSRWRQGVVDWYESEAVV